MNRSIFTNWIVGFLTLGGCWQLSRLAYCEVVVESASSRVDRMLSEEIFAQLSPGELAPLTDDLTFLRRVWLDLLGKIPPSDEMTAFERSRDPQKRGKLVDRLLEDPDFGRNWGRYWRDVILYRRTEERAMATSSILTEYLAQHLQANTGWDQIAREFITATGEVRHNGNTGIIMAQAGEPENVAAEVARIFMGIQIQCAQCHDHPYDGWKRQQFHELAAFFPRVAVRRVRTMGERGFQVVADDQPLRRRKKGNRRGRGTLEHYMPDLENPTAPGQLIQPALFATGQKLDMGTMDVNRRGKLSQWLTSPENEWFSKAMVNRIWSELVGEGFVEPIDDLGPDREVNAPRTFDRLSTEFAHNGYDVKWLFRTIMATEAYQRESRPRRQSAEPPFTANRPQPLRSDQLFDVFLQVMDSGESTPTRRSRRNMGKRGRNSPRMTFQKEFGFDPSQARKEVVASISQALVLMNSSQVNRAIHGGKPWGLGKWLREIVNDRELVHQLYRRCLAREPTAHETKICVAYVKGTGDRRVAFEDILWSLVNSSEFRYRI